MKFSRIICPIRAVAINVGLTMCGLIQANALGGDTSLARETAARIDALFAPFDRDDSPGYAVGVMRDRQLVFAKGYGRANLDDNIPITP